MQFKKSITLLFLILVICIPIEVIYGMNGKISGEVVSVETGDPLIGANVYIVGTSMGSATDNEGMYSITGIPPGSYTLRCTYIGYKTDEISIEIKIDEQITQDFQLEYEGTVKGEKVVITAQAQGQVSAINQQLSAKQIKNVVSSDRIQELPDANAAESIGRLPGVSITRVGGEGNKVVIRGLAPKYNQITIDGIRMASSNAEDRSTDLSMISSTMLEGIEVTKTVTADQDADVLGGTVNFKMREAKGGKEGIGLHALVQGGYTGLSNAYDKYNNYKIVPSIEGRFFNEKLGMFMQVNVERRNLSSNEFEANYNHLSADFTNYITESINLHFIPRDRQRFNGALVLDYRLPEGKVSLSNFASSGITEVVDRFESLNVNNNQHFYELEYSKRTLNMLTNTLNIEKQLPLVHADLKISHSYSETKSPDEWTVNFYHSPAGIGEFANKTNLNPKSVTDAVTTNPQKTILNTVSSTNSLAKERTMMGSLDMDFPVNISEMFTSVIKFGGKYRHKKRSYNAEVYSTNATFLSPSARGASLLIIDYFGMPGGPFDFDIPLSFFLDEDYDYGNFLDGDYDMHHPMQFSMIKDLADFCKDNIEEFADASAAEAFARNNYLSLTNNYSGKEILTAAYIMATIDIGPRLTVIPGIRYQNIKTTYSGIRGQQSTFSYNKYDHSDTTITESHPFWLPNVNIRYKALSWFDIRLSYSNTLSYPDYNTIIPRIDATTGADVAWNNFKLKPSRSENYDIYLTFTENKIGLFTVGGFVKQIDNLIYSWRFSKPGLEAAPYYLTDRDPASQLTYNINTFVNNPFVVTNWGLEFDWQTHFWYLPNPLKGLVLNVNYTHVKSEAEYPFVYAGATSATDIDTSFTDRLLYQPNHIFNFSLGYDYKGFSIRVSMLYQDDVFSGVSQWPQLRSTTSAYRRWDISFKQKLPWFGLQLYGNVNNLNNARDYNVLQMYPDTPQTAETYGMTADIGLRWQL